VRHQTIRLPSSYKNATNYQLYIARVALLFSVNSHSSSQGMEVFSGLSIAMCKCTIWRTVHNPCMRHRQSSMSSVPLPQSSLLHFILYVGQWRSARLLKTEQSTLNCTPPGALAATVLVETVLETDGGDTSLPSYPLRMLVHESPDKTAIYGC